nr:hypothetical protein [Tanacetum cinerariifolium]
MLVLQGEGSGTPTEPHYTPSPEAQQPSSTTPSSPTLPFVITRIENEWLQKDLEMMPPIKGRNLDEWEAAAKRVSDDTEEMAIVLTSMDVATILASGVAKVTTGSGSIPTASAPAAEVPTGSDVVPTAESETLKKKKIQEQMDIQMARQLEEEMERDAQRMNKQIARDAEI